MTPLLISLLVISLLFLGLAMGGKLDPWGDRLLRLQEQGWNQRPSNRLLEAILMAPGLGILLGFLLRHDDRFAATHPNSSAWVPAMWCSLMLLAFVGLRMWRVHRWLADTASCSPQRFAAWRRKENLRSALVGIGVGVVLGLARQHLGISEPFVLAGLTAALALQERTTALAQETLEARAAQLSEEARSQEARANALQDQALRAKLAPHFIFNTLNTLKAQITVDPRSAEATTDRLASLFRQVVQVADQPTIPLRQELAFVEAYLGIEQARLGDRLQVAMDIPEDLDDRPVPPLSLQVLVENAIKHGIAPFEHPGTVTIRAEAIPEGLRLSVSDTGLGSATQPGTGTALATLRQRLASPEDLVLERLESGFRASFTWRQP